MDLESFYPIAFVLLTIVAFAIIRPRKNRRARKPKEQTDSMQAPAQPDSISRKPGENDSD